MTRRFRDILIVSYPVLAAWSALAGLPVDNAASLVRMETFRTHSRLSFHVDDGIASDFKSNDLGFELELKGVGLGDLGAPLGEEAQWAAHFKKVQDPRLGSLEFAEVAGGVRVKGQWKYAQGPEAPANPSMESFDYREHEKGRLVIDFWVKEGPTLGEVNQRKAATRRIASVKQHVDDEKARAEHRIAREKARALAEDPKLFCGTPLSDSSDVFLRFLPVHEPVYFARWFSTVSPDADYTYYAPTGKAQDAQYVRLAFRLYHEGNFALVNRTIDFFEAESPESLFRSEMRFLRANALLKLGMTEEASQLLREIQHEPKGTRASQHAGMYLALQQWEAKNYLAALESFSWLSDHQAENRQAWVFHLGAAESARALKQTDRAAKEYQWVAEHAPGTAAQAEGALRIGDLYLDRFQYDQALAAYAIAIRHFEKEAALFPSIYINRADAFYGLGQFDRAGQAYREFLDHFPSHPAGWRATYRLGELAARGQGVVVAGAKGAAKPAAKANPTRESREAQDWYIETVNRFPFSPGAMLARMRLLPCGTHAGLTPEAADRFFATEAEKFDGAGEVSMERYKDFRALSRVRSLMTLGKQEEAVSTAIDELKRVSRAEAARWLSHLLVFNFRKSVVELLESGQKLAALTFYQKNADTVPLSDGTVDPDYLLKLSQAASDLSLGKLAESIANVFEKARKSHEAVGRELASDQGSPSDPDVKLATSERAFTEAKALWIGDGMKAANDIRARLGQVAPESRFSFEREIILGLIEARGGDAKAALRHAAQAQLLGPHSLRLDAWVAILEAQVGDPHAALIALRDLEGKVEAATKDPSAGASSVTELLGVPAAPGRESLILTQSEILEKDGRFGESAANYERAMGNGWGGAGAKYGYARALLRVGGKENHEKAIATLEKLAAEEIAQAKAVEAGAVASVASGTAAQPSGSGGAQAKGAKGEAAQLPQAQENDKFWRKLASETLADEKAKNDAREGMKQ